MSRQSKALDILVMARGGVEENITSPKENLLEPTALVGISTSIDHASKSITEAISHPASTPFVSTTLYIAIVTALCSTTGAYIYNKLHWRAVTARESRIKAAESLIDILTMLDELAVDYWIKNYSKRYSRENTKCEIKIKSCLNLINTLIPSLVSKVKRRERKVCGKKLRDFHEELFDLITGDDFETTSRKSNLVKAARISNRCLQFKVELVNLSV